MKQRFGKFRILSSLGEDCNGSKFLAEEETIGHRVVLKIHRPSTQRAREQFLKEAERLARISDPRVVTIHEYGECEGQVFYTRKWIEGKSLAEMHGELDLRALLETLAEVAQALHEVHLHGIVHRDMRPEHILLDGSGKPRITNFSLAREVRDQSMSRSGSFEGDKFRSPEWRQGQAIDHHADIYSLGAILDLLCTNRLVSPDLRKVILKAKALQPTERYATAGQFAQDLQNCLSSRRVHLARRRIPARNLAFAGFLALLGALSAFHIVQNFQLPDGAEEFHRMLYEEDGMFWQEMCETGDPIMWSNLTMATLGSVKFNEMAEFLGLTNMGKGTLHSRRLSNKAPRQFKQPTPAQQGNLRLRQVQVRPGKAK